MMRIREPARDGEPNGARSVPRRGARSDSMKVNNFYIFLFHARFERGTRRAIGAARRAAIWIENGTRAYFYAHGVFIGNLFFSLKACR